MFRYSSRPKKSAPAIVPLAVKLQQIRAHLKSDPVVRQSISILREVLQVDSPPILCLGLGSPTSSVNARAQLAFLAELREGLSIVRLRARCRMFLTSQEHISLYDPAFTNEDRSIFAHLDFHVLPEENACRLLSMPSVI
jgi:hypothetical protein